MGERESRIHHNPIIKNDSNNNANQEKKNVFNTQTLNGHLFGLVFFTNIRPRFELVLNLINQEKEDCNAGHTLNSMIIIIMIKMIIYLIISFHFVLNVSPDWLLVTGLKCWGFTIILLLFPFNGESFKSYTLEKQI